MTKLFGQDLSKEEIKQYYSTLNALAGVRMVELADGRARGIRAAEVWNGSGLAYTIYIDRGFDVGPASFCGKPLAWQHPALAAPSYYEAAGIGFLRTFGGGLVATCGLTHFGPPDQSGEEPLGLHGRFSNLPAENVHSECFWEGDEYIISVYGEVRQSVLFGENILLKRKITTKLNSKSFLMEDQVINDGYRSTPHMILYHCNFGFPVVSPFSEVKINDLAAKARDEVAEVGINEWSSFSDPIKDYREQVFYHFPKADDSGFVTASIFNQKLNFGAYLRYRSAELPALTQWKMIGPGEYVCGLEPGTNHVVRRSALIHDGTLKMLEPGETIDYSIEIGALE